MQTKTVDVQEAQTHLVELLSLVTAGTEIIVMEGRPPWHVLYPWRERHRGLLVCTLVPSGPVRTLTTHCPTPFGQAPHEGAPGYACVHLVG